MIVDASAILAIVFGEADAPQFAAALATPAEKWLSPVNWLEVQLRLLRLSDDTAPNAVEKLLRRANCSMATIDPIQAKFARDAYQKYGKGRHKAALNLGDCFAYALAQKMRQPLLYKGQDFIHTDIRSVL